MAAKAIVGIAASLGTRQRIVGRKEAKQDKRGKTAVAQRVEEKP